MSNADKFGSEAPPRGSAAWRKNEKIINETPALKRGRDQVQGIKKSEGAYTGSPGGKGSTSRPLSVSRETFEDNWDRIFSKRKKSE